MISKEEIQLSEILKKLVTRTPVFVTSEDLLIKNLKVLEEVQNRSGAKILLALKAFSQYETFPLLREVLSGTCASSPNEARMGKEEFKKEVTTFAAAYSEKDMQEVIKYSDHIIFNSFSAKARFAGEIKSSGKNIDIGIRLNPEHSEGAVDIYNPCSSSSRLGIRLKDFKASELDDVAGFHWHTLCQQNSDAMKRTLDVVEKKFGAYFKDRKWLNLGGGHHITRHDYDIETLIEAVKYLKTTYGVEVYLEPGEAVALNAGFMVATVLDILEADMKIGILDASAACHMPDVLEMPYRPEIIGAGKKDEKKYSYRFAGKSCLAGDVIGEYSFDEPLNIGDKLVFTDMAIYSMVKTNTFNGLDLPSLAILKQGAKKIKVTKEFGYNDFKRRL